MLVARPKQVSLGSLKLAGTIWPEQPGSGLTKHVKNDPDNTLYIHVSPLITELDILKRADF